MKSMLIILMLLVAGTALAGPADPIDQAALAKMDAVQLQAEFDSTIAMARQQRDQLVNQKPPRLKPGVALIPIVGGIAVAKQGVAAANQTQESTAKMQELQNYRLKLLQLKRELRARFPQAWEETKRKWTLDDNYLER